MKDTERPTEPAGGAQPRRPQDTAGRRIALALLDEYSSPREDKGYDPYNAHAGSNAANVWGSKRRRR